MTVISNRYITWVMMQTRIMRYCIVAILLHVSLVAYLGSRKVDLVPSQVFDGPVIEMPVFPPIEDRNQPVPTDAGVPPLPPSMGDVVQPQPSPAITRHLPVPENVRTGGVGVDSPMNPGIPLDRFFDSPAGLPFSPGGDGLTRGDAWLRASPADGTVRQRDNAKEREKVMNDLGGNPATERGVMGALRWLKNNQRPDGSWKCGPSDRAGTALAALALLGHGETTDKPEFGQTVHRALSYLETSIDERGLVPGGKMYEQGLVTLALSEGYLMTQAPSLREPLERAVKALVQSQQTPKALPLHRGGWRYSPTATDADLSVSGWIIMALKSAKNAGVDVPQQTFDDAAGFVWRMYRGPGFGYDAPGVTPNMTAVGVLCLQFLGHGQDERVKKALDYLRTQKFDWQKTGGGFVLYGWYYLTQAMFQGGDPYWTYWNREFRDELLTNQAEDGSWPVPPLSDRETKDLAGSPVYATAMGAMMLEVYYRHLPLYKTHAAK